MHVLPSLGERNLATHITDGPYWDVAVQSAATQLFWKCLVKQKVKASVVRDFK